MATINIDPQDAHVLLMHLNQTRDINKTELGDLSKIVEIQVADTTKSTKYYVVVATMKDVENKNLGQVFMVKDRFKSTIDYDLFYNAYAIKHILCRYRTLAMDLFKDMGVPNGHELNRIVNAQRELKAMVQDYFGITTPLSVTQEDPEVREW